MSYYIVQGIYILIQVAVVLLCITVHEFSHGYMAYRLGDDTAKRQGRLTLNPIKHLDPIGAIMLLVARFGWAKPVPVNPYNFQNMKTGMALTAVAGPASNFVFAILAAFLYRELAQGTFFTAANTNFFITCTQFFLQMLVVINCALGLFNLLPIPPLDGSKIIGGFMSDDLYFRWMEWERKGAFVLMAIILISFVFKIPILARIIYPPLNFLTNLLIGVEL